VCVSGAIIATIWWNYFDVCVRQHFCEFYCVLLYIFYCFFFLLLILSVCLYVSRLCLWALLPDLNKITMMIQTSKLIILVTCAAQITKDILLYVETNQEADCIKNGWTISDRTVPIWGITLYKATVLRWQILTEFYWQSIGSQLICGSCYTAIL